ncbi:hypothetical protein [Paenibacillus oceani]|uniref:SWIM-type domain-containing protein n=1 Tax=Paenibacillus oceani TaxID=2772510 RepID=A0A927CDF2_9BACL|nr:hypothetical protein [Paenibacillus oceani]MBD2864792.1 hypothetical protein [Paenibacillus oceani]
MGEKEARLSREHIQYLWEEALANFPVPLLQTGWTLYRSISDSHSKVNAEKSTYTCNVVDKGRTYAVMIDYDFFNLTTCDCGSVAYCAHIAAAVMSLLSMQGKRPELLIREAEERVAPSIPSIVKRDGTKKPSSAPNPPSLLTPKKVKEQKDQLKRLESEQASLKENSDAESWSRLFAGLYEKRQNTMQGSVHVQYSLLLQEFDQSGASLPETLRELYRIYMRLELLHQMEHDWKKSEISFYMSYYNQYYHTCNAIQEEIRVIARQINRSVLYSRYGDKLEQTAQMLHQFIMIGGANSPAGWLILYRYLWWGMLNHSEYCERELVRLQRQMKRPEATLEQVELARLGLLHMRMLEGDEQTALELFAQQTVLKDPVLVVMYLHYFKQTDRWDTLQKWLRWMIPFMKQDDEEFLETYVHDFWEPLVKRTGKQDELLQAMTELLPYSSDIYGELLLKMKRYQQWVDLQMTLDYSPGELDDSDLRKVSAGQPEMLLPLYHQSIERCIAWRKRDAYQEAAHYLTKLRDCYYKLKSPERWNEYFAHLRDKHSRLRAFQEELKRSKLIL